jgi:hypothetical protein
VTQPLQVTPRELILPEGQDFFLFEREGDNGPEFSTKQVSQLFFGRTKQWLFFQFKAKKDYLDGEKILPRYTIHGYQRWNLWKLERLTHALIANGAISTRQFERSMIIIKLMGENVKLIPVKK